MTKSVEDEPELRRGPGPRTVAATLGVLVLIGIVTAVLILRGRPATGDAGRLTQAQVTRPVEVPLPVLVDVTNDWGLGEWSLNPADDQMAGGVAVGDIDGSGRRSLIVANGDVAITQLNARGRYDPPRLLGVQEAIGVSVADLDGDGNDDLLVATALDVDVIFWGGSWLDSGSEPQVTELEAAGQSSGLLAGELTGDGRIDIVRLGRGMDDPAPDILWVAAGDDRRSYSPTVLPVPDRFSLAGELVDADGDGLLDIWITRDVGWARGGDSVLSRQGDPAGEWVDIAPALGADLEVDGMGITIADLNGDAQLDAYVSDLGDNEQLLGTGQGFTPSFDTGAAHIRPIGAPAEMVSSTWGTGAFDVNLDGVLDLVLASGGFPAGAVRNKIEGTEVVVAESPAILLGVGNGTFVDVWPELGMAMPVVARGLSVADLDLDGDDDIVIADRRGSVHVLRNDTVAAGGFLTISAGPDCENTAGVVATVETTSGSFQRLLGPHGYASSHAPSVTVGVAAGESALVTLSGPDPTANPVSMTVEAGRSIALPCG